MLGAPGSPGQQGVQGFPGATGQIGKSLRFIMCDVHRVAARGRNWCFGSADFLIFCVYVCSVFTFSAFQCFVIMKLCFLIGSGLSVFCI